MVDVHYIKRGNKSYGHYYYRSYRVGNKIKKEYLGKDYPGKIQKSRKNKKLLFFFVLPFLVVLIIFLAIFFSSITGKTVLDFNFQQNESLHTSNNNLTAEIIDSVSSASPQANLSDLTSITLNETSKGNNESDLAQISAAEQPVEINSTRVSEIIVQHKAVIGKPVKWTKRVVLETPGNVTVELPKEASNIAIKKIVNGEAEPIPTNSAGITGHLTAEIKLTGIQKKQTPLDVLLGMLGRLREAMTGKVVKETGNGESWILNEIRQIFRAIRATITGHAVEEISGAETETDKVVEIKEVVKEVEIEYETPAPTADEIRLTQYSKRIIISSETHYTDILSYAFLPVEVSGKEAIRLYLLADGSRQEAGFAAYDKNNNTSLDYIEWIIPSLSNQTYEIYTLNPNESCGVTLNDPFCGRIKTSREDCAGAQNCAWDGNECSPPGSGDWMLNCALNCNYTEPINVTKDVIISAQAGNGTVSIHSNWNFNSTNQHVYVEPGCEINIYSGGGFNIYG